MEEFLDGSQIVFTRIHGNARSDREFWGGSIVQMQIDIENLTLQDEVVLKEYNPDINYFYPAYSPDGEWILYVQASNTQESSVKGASAKSDQPDDHCWIFLLYVFASLPTTYGRLGDTCILYLDGDNNYSIYNAILDPSGRGF